MKPELEMGSSNEGGAVIFRWCWVEKVVRQCERWRCGRVRLRLAMRTAAPNETGERT